MLLHHTQGWPFGFRRDFTSELDQVFRDFSRIMGDGSRNSRFLDRSAGVYPLMNVSQDGENYYVRSEIPGVPSEALEVSVTGRSLTVSGERKIEEEGPKVNRHRRERQEGKFRRQISLPGDVNADKVQAQYRHGILMVVIPKAENAKPRKVSISG
jgi:HSP20 family protein